VIRVRISDDALADLNEGYWFYEAQDRGLGDYFGSSLRADIEGLKVTGGVHPVVYRDYHRVLSRIFPYGVYSHWGLIPRSLLRLNSLKILQCLGACPGVLYYTLDEDFSIVWAVIDLRRDPEWIRDRLNE
jgi:hypothetical protein